MSDVTSNKRSTLSRTFLLTVLELHCQLPSYLCPSKQNGPQRKAREPVTDTEKGKSYFLTARKDIRHCQYHADNRECLRTYRLQNTSPCDFRSFSQRRSDIELLIILLHYSISYVIFTLSLGLTFAFGLEGTVATGKNFTQKNTDEANDKVRAVDIFVFRLISVNDQRSRAAAKVCFKACFSLPSRNSFIPPPFRNNTERKSNTA